MQDNATEAPPAPPREVLEHKETTDKVATFAAVGGALFGASAAATGLMVLGTGCSSSIPSVLHPTGIEIDNSEEMGAQIMNVAIAVAFAVLCFLACRLVMLVGGHFFPKLFKGLDTQGFMRLPSVPLVLFQFLYQGISLAGMNVVLHFVKAWHAVVGFAVLIVCVVVPVALVRTLFSGVGRLGVFATVVERRNTFSVFFLGKGEWVNLREERLWVERYSSVLRRFRQSTTWFIAIDYLAAFSVSAIRATNPDTFVGCGHVKAVSGLVLLIVAALILWVRPHSRARDTLLEVLIYLLQVAAMAFMAVGYYHSDETFWTFAWGSVLLLGSAGVMVFKLLCDLVNVLYLVVTGKLDNVQDNVYAQFKAPPTECVTSFAMEERGDLPTDPLILTPISSRNVPVRLPSANSSGLGWANTLDLQEGSSSGVPEVITPSASVSGRGHRSVNRGYLMLPDSPARLQTMQTLSDSANGSMYTDVEVLSVNRGRGSITATAV